jgi:signal transduction histidine kinase
MLKRLIFAISILVFVVGGILSYFVFKQTGIFQRKSLISRVETVSSLLGSEDILNIDLLKEKFKGVVAANSDIRFAYALAESQEGVIFIADSEDPSSPDYSPYGQVYDEASDVLLNIFDTKASAYEIASDRWGTWFSVLSAITLDDGSVVVVGLDIDADSYYRTIYVYTSIPISITVVLLILLISAYRIHKKDEETRKVKSSFISQASHDLRSPLSGIRWGSETLLKSKEVLTKEQQDTLNMIYVSTIKIASILKDLMQITVIDARIKKDVVKNYCDIASVVQESVKDLTLFSKEKNISIDVNVVEGSLFTWADAQDLKQVFSNLLSNSIKYSNSGTSVQITTTTYAKYNVVSIIDHGIGIPAAEVKNVEQGFYRSTNARKMTEEGTGLGLYSAKKVVELYRGTLTFKSEENKGSTFIVTLPKANAK